LAQAIADDHDSLPAPSPEFDRQGHCQLGRPRSAHDFDQRHAMRGREEVNAHDAFRMGSPGRDSGDGQS
jgi:hypothetical protein